MAREAAVAEATANERGVRGIRASWRQEIDAEALAMVSRILADVVHHEVQPAVRLAAAGRELLYQRGFVEATERMLCEGELKIGSLRIARTLEEAGRALAELVARLELHLGAFPDGAEPWRSSGVRETFLVGIDPQRRKDVLWLIETASQGSDAPEPGENLLDMRLRAVGEDVAEVGRFLGELAEEVTGEGEFRDLVREVVSGCAEIDQAIRQELGGSEARAEAPAAVEAT